MRLKVGVAFFVMMLGLTSLAAAGTETSLFLNGEAGDYISGGLQETFTAADGGFQAQSTRTETACVTRVTTVRPSRIPIRATWMAMV